MTPTPPGGRGRYSRLAPLYDLLAAEPVYRAGRIAAVEHLRLRPGDEVLDIGCGTGLNFAHVLRAIGPRGRIIGLDASHEMLAQADRRARSLPRGVVHLVEADATSVDVDLVLQSFRRGAADAVLSTYALSLMTDWPQAWRRAVELTRDGGRIAITDMELPSGRWRVLSPLARLAGAAGGADLKARPWTALEHECVEVESVSLRGGHVQVRAGTRHGHRADALPAPERGAGDGRH